MPQSFKFKGSAATVIVILNMVGLLLKSTEIGTYQYNLFKVQTFRRVLFLEQSLSLDEDCPID